MSFDGLLLWTYNLSTRNSVYPKYFMTFLEMSYNIECHEISGIY